MADADRLWRALGEGSRLWPWQRRTARATVDPERAAVLVWSMVGLSGAGRRMQVAHTLRLVVPEGLHLDLASVQLLLEATSPHYELTAMAEWRGNLAADVGAQTARLVLRRARVSSAAQLRQVLALPPKKAYDEVSGCWQPTAAKLAALELLDEQLQSDDAGLLLELVAANGELQAVRNLALERLAALTGTAHAEQVGGQLLSSPLRRPLWPVHSLPAPFRQALVAPLSAGLVADDHETRHRALTLLAMAGASAAPALAACARATDDLALLRDVEEVLARFDRPALHEARAGRKADGRALSPADLMVGDPERGLSASQTDERPT